MKSTLKLLLILLLAAGLTSCGKKNEETEKKQQEKVTEKVTEQMQTTTGEETQKQEPVKDTLNKPAGDKTDMDTGEKVSIKVTPDEKKYLNDPKGQWAYDVLASSTRANLSDDFDAGYSTIKLIGKPDVDSYGDNKSAWCPAGENKGAEWFEVLFAKPVNATEFRLRQTFHPGAVTKIELIDEKVKSHLIWEGSDNNQYKPNTTEYLIVSFAKTPYKVKRVKVTLSTNKVPGWNEFDAAQLIGE
jgi:hypothetical protein